MGCEPTDEPCARCRDREVARRNESRDQLKANCTRVLRETDNVFVDRPAWTVGGDVEFLDSEDDLESAVLYAGEAQDRKGRDQIL